MAREINAELLDTKIEKAQQDFAVRYGDIIILLYHEDMMYVRELLFKNSQKEKTL